MDFIFLAMLVAILACLAGAGYFMLSRKNEQSLKNKRMANMLAWRIGLSIALVVGILIAWQFGLIEPHQY
jgi:uncharacterized protein YacL